MARPTEVDEAICFKLSEPTDRRSLRATCRPLLPIVDGSWRDLQELTVRFADLPSTKTFSSFPNFGRRVVDFGSYQLMLGDIPADDDRQSVTVYGRMKNPNSGKWSKFKQTMHSVKTLQLLKWIGHGVPSVELRTNDRYFRHRYDRYAPITDVVVEYAVKFWDDMKWIGLSLLKLGTNRYHHDGEIPQSPKTATDRHPITDVLLACADGTVMGSVVDVSVTSRRLLYDRSLVDALVRWADCRHASHNDRVPFWRSLTLDPGNSPTTVSNGYNGR